MLIRGVRNDLVDHHFEVKPMRFCQQLIKIVQRAKNWINAAIVGDVIAKIFHRRGEKRRKPNCIDAQICHIIQTVSDTLKVTNAIAIAVLKRTRVNLIDDRTAPPVFLFCQSDSGVRIRLGHMVHQWSFLPLFIGGEAIFAISDQIDYRWFQGFQNVLVDYFYPRWIALVNQLLKVG